MSIIEAQRSVEIAAPVEKVFGIVADLERIPEWDQSVKSVQVRERDAEGRGALVESEVDAKVRTSRQVMRYSYEAPRQVSWVMEKGDVKSLTGSWTLEALDADRTRATYAVATDPGRMIGMLLKGPMLEKVKDMMLSSATTGLKTKAESVAG